LRRPDARSSRDERVHDRCDGDVRRADLLRPRRPRAYAGRGRDHWYPGRLGRRAEAGRPRGDGLAAAPAGRRAGLRRGDDADEGDSMSGDLFTLERIVGRVLTIGTVLSGTILSVGLLLSLIWPGHALTNRILTAGILVLFLTPALRVLISFGDYIIEREWWFVLYTGIVLMLLASGFVAAFAR